MMRAHWLGAAAVGGFVIAGNVYHSYPTAPDPKLTPGAVATSDRAVICARGGLTYSQAHRQTSTALKDWVFREYGIAPPYGAERGNWEIDHLVPLCLGGADEAANLWPQNRESFPIKDRLEAAACRLVCSGQVTVEHAQSWFLGGDWQAGYREVFGQEL